MSESDEPGFDTLAVRAGQQRTAEGEHAEPIFPTSSYVFSSAAEAAAPRIVRSPVGAGAPSRPPREPLVAAIRAGW